MSNLGVHGGFPEKGKQFCKTFLVSKGVLQTLLQRFNRAKHLLKLSIAVSVAYMCQWQPGETQTAPPPPVTHHCGWTKSCTALSPWMKPQYLHWNRIRNQGFFSGAGIRPSTVTWLTLEGEPKFKFYQFSGWISTTQPQETKI